MFENVIFSMVVVYNVYWALNNVYNQYPVLITTLLKIIPKKKWNNKNYEDIEYPDIHVILAAYREEDVLPYSVKKFVEVAKNYRGKVKLWLALEEHDKETRRVAEELEIKYRDYVNVVIVPKEYPHGVGKPRALNYTFRKIEGEILPLKREDKSIIGVLDAEDIISQNLFYEVVRKIHYENYDAVQGILHMRNEDGWKNLMFRGEYGMWFRILLLSKVENNLPLPFGGTTNFFPYKTLKEMEENPYGPWDPYNLTEDFDLGIRMFLKDGGGGKRKFKVGMINSITYEESPVTWEGWLRQRTRWQQGKIQTFRKILRKFRENSGEATRNFPKTCAVIMECSVAHLGFINILGISLSIYAFMAHMDFGLAKFLMLYNLGSVIYYFILHGIGYYMAVRNEKTSKIELLISTLEVALTTPFYWIPQWIADLRAMKREYIDRSGDWEKTQHHGKHIKGKKNEN